MRMAVKPKHPKTQKVFGLQQTLGMRTEGNFTSKKVDLILRHMRDALEPGTVAPNQRVQARGFKNIFSSLTTTETLTFKDKDGQDIQRPFTYSNDPAAFKSSIASMRNKDVKRLGTKYGLDNGQVK